MRRRALVGLAAMFLSCGAERPPAEPPQPIRTPDATADAGPPKVARLEAGPFSTCAITDEGALWCWGRDVRDAVHAPRRIDGLENVRDVTIGVGYTCAALADGHITCWGRGTATGVFPGHLQPHRWTVPKIDDAREVAGGTNSACALTRQGVVRCWGQLGMPSHLYDPERVVDIPLPGKVSQIAASRNRFCALASRQLWCWRDKRDEEPQRLGTRAYVDLAMTNEDSVCAVGTQGHLDCWGRACSPTSRVWGKQPCNLGVSSGATAVVAGHHACALIDGTWKCWGDNELGHIATDATRSWLASLTEVPIDSANIERIAAGTTHTCALLDEGTIKCWGLDVRGELGRGPMPRIRRRYRVNRRAREGEFSIGENHACVVGDPAPRCWGVWTTGPKHLLAGPPAGNLVVEAAGATLISSGQLDVCASRPGALICWGTGNRFQPRVSALKDAHSIAIGQGFRCAVGGSDRRLHCAGWRGTLLQSSSAPSHIASDELTVLDEDVGIVAAGAGAKHVCWALDDGAVKCRGLYVRDFDGESQPAGDKPLLLGRLPGVRRLAAGRGFTCALAKGKVSCWGANEDGQLGNGSWQPYGGRQEIELPPMRDIAASNRHVCAVGEDGSVWCWGLNIGGELGLGDGIARNTPQRVPGIAGAVDVVAAPQGTCAILGGNEGAKGDVICWGELAQTLFDPDDEHVTHPPAPVLRFGAPIPRPKLEIVSQAPPGED